MRLSYVQLPPSIGVHDPAREGPPSPETMRTVFTEAGYLMDMAGGVVVISSRQRNPNGPNVVVPFSLCRFAVIAEEQDPERLADYLGTDEFGRPKHRPVQP